MTKETDGLLHMLKNEGRVGESRCNVFTSGETDQRISQLKRELEDHRNQLESAREQLRREIRARHELEESAQQLLQRLERTGQELNDFTYIVSHDLKAPLRGVDTLANWLMTDYRDELDEEGRQLINLLVDRVKRLENLIEGILQYSRIGRVTEGDVMVDLNQLLARVIEKLPRPDSIEIRVEDELPSIFGPPTRLEQIFQHLIANAIESMDKPAGQIIIGGVEDDGYWQFRVADNGPGIDERHWNRIFQIFQSLSPHDKTEHTGLGLTLVKKMVELYGGKIWLESKLGQGTTFFFRLPMTGQEKSDPASPAA